MTYTTAAHYSTGMNSYQSVGMMVALMLILLLPTAIWYRQYWRAKVMRCLVVALVTLAAAAVNEAMRLHVQSPWTMMPASLSLTQSPLMAGEFGAMDGFAEFLAIVCYFAGAVLAVGIAGRAYRAWVLDLTTDIERRGDKVGLRAWLRPMDVMSVLGVGVCAYFGMGWSPWTSGALALMVLLSFPVVNIMMASDEDPDGGALAEERQRVLAMVEAGKITGEDAAELISALGAKPTGVQASVRMTGNRRMMLAGAGLAVVGFCLPWFYINVGEQAAAMMREMQGVQAGQVSVPVETILLERGGDVGHGLGWIILGCALVVGALPLVWPAGARGQAQKPVAMGALVAGSVVWLYLASGMFSWSSVGLWVMALAYGILWVGVVREYVRVSGVARVAVG